ncbi:MAG: hypothetical protein H6813_03115 [Phycisphaeraceae bacterium]|nr:hypothetical protein [Phycisphaeraceae bacterium]MCB9846935.1 hypothetical protein [Phycisphaeraceae bacterium]
METRPSLELATTLAANCSSLPAIATCNWCETAANLFSSARPRCVAIVRFVDREGDTPREESWPNIGVCCRPADPALAESARDAMERLRPCLQMIPVCGEDDDGEPCNSKAFRFDPDEAAGDPMMPMLAALGARSAILAMRQIDRARGVNLCVLIADRSTTGALDFDDDDAQALCAVMRLVADRAVQAYVQAPGDSVAPLNLREVKVLESLTQGMTIREIAGEMHRSTHTIHDYLKSMHRKIGVGCRAELIARASGRFEPRSAPEPGSEDRRESIPQPAAR